MHTHPLAECCPHAPHTAEQFRCLWLCCLLMLAMHKHLLHRKQTQLAESFKPSTHTYICTHLIIRYCMARSCICSPCEGSAPITDNSHEALLYSPAATASPSSTASAVPWYTTSPAAVLFRDPTADATAGVVAVARKLKTTKDRVNREVFTPKAACNGTTEFVSTQM
jgi:hypothetical protein